ncbi:hypothetical protein D3C72_1861750 [compost metagenome]
MHGQVASHVSSLLAGRLDVGGDKLGLWVLSYIEEVFAGDVLVTLSVVGPQAGGFQINRDLAGFRLGRVPSEGTIEILEGTVNEAVTQVADLPVNEGMLAFLVDLVVCSHGLAGRKQCGTERQSGKSLFQHASISFGVEVEHQALRPSMRVRVASRSIKWCFRAATPCNPAKITRPQAR